MKTESSFSKFFEQSYESDAFWEELAILGFTGSVVERLKALEMSKKALSEKMGVSPSYVTKLIGGSNNFTLRTMVKIARQLKCELNISLRAAVASVKAKSPKCETPELPSNQMVKRAANDYEDLALAA